MHILCRLYISSIYTKIKDKKNLSDVTIQTASDVQYAHDAHAHNAVLALLLRLCDNGKK